MELKFKTKMVPRVYCELDGVDFLAKDILYGIEEMQDTSENDSFGYNSLRDYELNNIEVTKKFVKLGLVKEYAGPQHATCYCVADMNKMDELSKMYYDELESYESTNR